MCDCIGDTALRVTGGDAKRSRLTSSERAMDQAISPLKAPFDRATVHVLCCVLEKGCAQIRRSYTGTLAENAEGRDIAVARVLSLLGPAAATTTGGAA